jgi:hypothetical protein
MATRKLRRFRVQFPAVAAAILAGACALPLPAHAQFFGDRWGYDQPYRRQVPPPQGFFSFPSFNRPFPRYGSPQPPAESYRAPAPHKQETPPTSTVAVIGDSMADWLAYGLEEIYADQQQTGIVRKIRPNSGLVHYEPRNDTLQWSQAIKDDVQATDKPVAIVVMLGLNDRAALRALASPHEEAQHGGKEPKPAANEPAQPGKEGNPGTESAPQVAQQPDEQSAATTEVKTETKTEAATDTQHPVPGVTYDFRTDDWAKIYAKRIDDMIGALKSKGVPVLWVGLPALRGPRATSDMSYLDDLFHAAADRAGITYVDIWDGFVDEDGRYTVEGPDFEGQTRRLRTSDGIHFTKFGALKLAHLVDQELSRILANPAAPVALPSPQASLPAKPGAARPVVGPVLPLTSAGGGGGGQLDGVAGGGLLGGGLLGGGNHPAPIASEDSTAKNVLVHGDPLLAPAGRADDFAWPPHDADNGTAAPPASPAKP